MLNLESDYIEGAHPLILQRLVETNMEALSGYGVDCYSESAKEKIRKALNCEKAQITFITGGTQTNQLVIDSVLKSYEGVVAADTGHVSTHEAGAIEHTGHKVLTIPSLSGNDAGKISAEKLNNYIEDFYADANHEHEVFPGMVYISQPTEYGTIYSKQELSDLHEVCKKFNIPLYADGARLGYALASSSADFTLEDMAEYCDIFYIGGTKVGALCGEALVFTRENEPAHFVNLVKKHGALLAKGRLCGIQFDTLFTDNLYLEISRNAILMAEKIKKGFTDKGYSLLMDSPTNQQFIILENKRMAELAENVKFCFWQKVDETHTAVRFASSWATTEENVNKLLELL